MGPTRRVTKAELEKELGESYLRLQSTSAELATVRARERSSRRTFLLVAFYLAIALLVIFAQVSNPRGVI